MAETKLKNQALNLIGAKVTLSADITLNNGSVTQITFDTEEYDTGSAFASNTFTVPAGKDGTYLISTSMYIYSTVTAGSQYRIEIYKNGASVQVATSGQTITNTGFTLTASTTLQLAATDYITFYAFAPHASAKVYGAQTTHTWAYVQQLTQS